MGALRGAFGSWPARVGATALVVVALDWGTQFWVSHALVLNHQIGSAGPVQIYYMENEHQIAAWTILLGLVGVAGVAVLLRRDLPHFPWWVQVASGAFLGGFLGNSLEDLVVGHVVDFIQIPLPVLGEGVGNPADAGVFAGLAVAGGGGLAVAAIHRLPETLPGWLRHGAAAVLAIAAPLSMLLGSLWLYGAYGGGHTPPPPTTTATTSSVPEITAIASSPGSRTLAIRGGHVEWLSLHPTRWTPVTLPTGFDPPLAGPMRPTAVAVTSGGVGLAGMSDGVVLEIAPGARHAESLVADSLWGRVVALAGMGTLGHLEMLLGTTSGTYSVGLKGPLAVWWPHKEATAVVAPANSQGLWAAIVSGRLEWAPAVEPTPYDQEPLVPWTAASGRYLGTRAFLTEYPAGGIAVATHGGAVLDGALGSGLNVKSHTLPSTPFNPSPGPTGLASTAGNVVVLSSTNSPLLGWGWESTWRSVGGVASVHILAAVGGNVVEVLKGGSLNVVAIDPLLAYMPTQRSVPGWVGPALGLAVLLVLLVLAGFAAWRLPWRPRVAVFAAVGVVLFGLGGVAVGRFVIPPAARYTRSQVQEAWVNGVDAAGIGSWLLTPPQCGWLARAVGWHGPLPNEVTTAGEPSYGQLPNEVVPSCAVWAQQSPAQDHAAMRHPLSVDLNQDSTTYYLQVDLGPVATAAIQAAAQSACTRLGSACEPLGQNGHFVAYYAVRVALPHSFYSGWQKVMGGAA